MSYMIFGAAILGAVIFFLAANLRNFNAAQFKSKKRMAEKRARFSRFSTETEPVSRTQKKRPRTTFGHR